MRGIELLDQRVSQGSIITRAQIRPRQLPGDAGDMHEFVHRFRFLADVDKLLNDHREADWKMSVPGSAYVTNTGTAAVALVAATAKTAMYLNSGAADNLHLTEFCIGFDGVTSTAVPALVELMFGTKASNSTPGTGSTTFTPLQVRGWGVQAANGAAGINCSSEPTVTAVLKPYLVTPNGGLLVVQLPLGRETTSHNIASTSGLQMGLRLTAPAVVNYRGYFEHEE